ncbi:retrovirus-related pol polyprotein from transposon TNT 1-94 [Tanacetum coccineum]
MADMNIPANDVPAEQAPAIAPPTRTDEQILPFRKWVPVGKSNYVLDVLKSQRNPIFKLDEQWFNIHKDILRNALLITPIDDNNPFVAPPSSDAVIDYVNTLGYPCTLKNVFAMSVNDLYQPWRAILSMINLCITGKTVGHDRPRHHVLQIIWGIIHASTSIMLDDGLGMNLEVFEPGVAEEEAVPESPDPKAIKVTKPKADMQTKPSTPQAPKVTKPAGKKRGVVNWVKETCAPHASFAKRSKAGKVTKKRKSKSPLRLVDEFVDEGVPDKEPAYNDEEANFQRAVELSLKEQEERTQGPARLVVFREHDFGRFQPLLETLKKKTPADQFMFQRRTPMTTEPSRNVESPSLDTELALADSEKESDEVVTHGNKEKDASNKELTKINTRVQDEGQAGSNPGKQDKGQAGSNPGNTVEFQPQPSYVVHVGPNLEPMDLVVSDASTQQNPEQMDEDFTNQFFMEKPQEEEQEKTNAESKTTQLWRKGYKHGSRLYNLENLNIPQKVSKVVDEIITDVADWALQALLRACFRELPEADMKEILQQRIWETGSYKTHKDHKNLYEALEKSMDHDHSDQLQADLIEARKKRQKRSDSPRTPSGSPLPLPPPPPTYSGTLWCSKEL